MRCGERVHVVALTAGREQPVMRLAVPRGAARDDLESGLGRRYRRHGCRRWGHASADPEDGNHPKQTPIPTPHTLREPRKHEALEDGGPRAGPPGPPYVRHAPAEPGRASIR